MDKQEAYNKEQARLLIVGKQNIYLWDFYKFLFDKGFPHQSVLRYIKGIHAIFVWKPQIKELFASQDFLKLKELLLDFIRIKKDYVTRYSIKNYCDFLDKGVIDLSKPYLRFYEEISKEINKMDFPTKREKNIVTTTQLKQIMEHISPYNFYLKRKDHKVNPDEIKIFLMALYETGLRVHALLKLKIEHINFDEKGRAWIFVVEKRGKRVKMPISMKTSQLMKIRLAEKEKAGDFFIGSYNSIRTYILRLIKKYRLPIKFNFHAVRRSRAQDIYNSSGHDIRKVKEYLHHSSILTSEIYIDTLQEDFTKIVDEVMW